jgi:hypothetical protein
LRKICGPTRDEITKEWGKLHNEELLYLILVRVIKFKKDI